MLVHFILFIIILFLYLHITDQYKKGENLEVYEMDYIDNGELQEVCNVKQPVIFDAPKENAVMGFFDKMRGILESYYGSYEVRVKDTNDYSKDNVIDSIGLPLQSAQNLFITDTQSHYFSEDNGTFLEETGMGSLYSLMNTSLKPPLILYTNEDIWFGSKGTATPLRYHTFYRRFLYVISGKVYIKLTPWKSTKYLNPIKDYEQYDFRSTYNPWSTEGANSSLQFVEAEVRAGQILYLPPYWWYSIQYVGDEPTYVGVQTYHSGMNIAAHITDLTFYFLQNHNIQKTYRKYTGQEHKEPIREMILPITNSNIYTNTIPVEETVESEKEATLRLTEDLLMPSVSSVSSVPLA